MIIFGINENAHDAALSVIKDSEILFAAHSERYSKIKNDWSLNDDIVKEALSYGAPDRVAYYEKPLLKNLRILLKGGKYDSQFTFKKYLKGVPVSYFNHHYSHAAAGYYTSKFSNAAIIVVDAIGEWNTTSIWKGESNNIKRVYTKNYPVSFGLFYSAFTQLLGFEPNKEEYIVMGLAAFGDPKKYYDKVTSYFPSFQYQKYNFHIGITDWKIQAKDKADVAAAVQRVYEERLTELVQHAYKLTKETNLVLMGGCALNCKANTSLWNTFDNVWIMPNSGDAGSSLGAAAALYNEHIVWNGPYLGHNITGDYPIDLILNDLITKKVSAVANGRAEFGPRALGNRSILADPRDPSIKHYVNNIKQREPFRPFAPVVMEEYASEYFDMNFTSPYMQYAVKCKKSSIIPSAVHIDGTSRVQTVNKHQHRGLYNLLEKWFAITGVPVLLNTSLNIKNQPLLNDSQDIELWEKTYNYKIR